ncbi:MAG TPA: hypothetical protein VFV38_41930 [Ktedonobacteraceae bacterium]|nr:hypothetical protein [Ktedonobacteraceae bacterium]
MSMMLPHQYTMIRRESPDARSFHLSKPCWRSFPTPIWGAQLSELANSSWQLVAVQGYLLLALARVAGQRLCWRSHLG